MIGLLDGNLTGIPSIELSQSLFTSSENRSLGGRTRTPAPLPPPLHHRPLGRVLCKVHVTLTIPDRFPTTAATKGRDRRQCGLPSLSIHTWAGTRACTMYNRISAELPPFFARPLDQSTKGTHWEFIFKVVLVHIIHVCRSVVVFFFSSLSLACKSFLELSVEIPRLPRV